VERITGEEIQMRQRASRTSWNRTILALAAWAFVLGSGGFGPAFGQPAAGDGGLPGSDPVRGIQERVIREAYRAHEEAMSRSGKYVEIELSGFRTALPAEFGAMQGAVTAGADLQSDGQPSFTRRFGLRLLGQAPTIAGQKVVDLVSKDGFKVGSFTVTRAENAPGLVRYNMILGELEVRVEAAPRFGEYRISIDGESVHLRFDGLAGQWIETPADSNVLSMYFAEIAFLAQVAEKVDAERLRALERSENLRVRSGRCGPAEPARSQGLGENGIDGLVPPWPTDPCCDLTTTLHGSSAGISRATCCLAAKEEVNLLCWNQFCTGCCEHLMCSAICFPGLGDFFCACRVDGNPCDAPTSCLW
jgi:hypothetical protein